MGILSETHGRARAGYMQAFIGVVAGGVSGTIAARWRVCPAQERIPECRVRRYVAAE